MGFDIYCHIPGRAEAQEPLDKRYERLLELSAIPRSEWAYKPGSVVSDHFSGLGVTPTARCDLPGRQTERTAP